MSPEKNAPLLLLASTPQFTSHVAKEIFLVGSIRVNTDRVGWGGGGVITDRWFTIHMCKNTGL